MNKTGLYWIAALVAVIFIGYVCYRRYARKTGEKGGGRKPETMEKEDIRREELPSLKSIIKYFKGQCNSFRMIAVKPRSMESCEKTFDYAENVINFHADGGLKEWWKTFAGDRIKWDLELYKAKAGLILSMLHASGVVSSMEQFITWNEDASKHYIPFDDLETGDVCQVIQPCWIYNDEIFEQGLVAKKIN